MEWYYVELPTGVNLYAKAETPEDIETLMEQDLALHPFFRRSELENAEITKIGMTDTDMHSNLTTNGFPNIAIYQKGDILMKIRRPSIRSSDKSSVSVKYRE